MSSANIGSNPNVNANAGSPRSHCRLRHSLSLPNIQLLSFFHPPTTQPTIDSFRSPQWSQLSRGIHSTPLDMSADLTTKDDGDDSSKSYFRPRVSLSKSQRQRVDRDNLLTPPLTPSSSIRTTASIESVATSSLNLSHSDVDKTIQSRCLLISNISPKLQSDQLNAILLSSLSLRNLSPYLSIRNTTTSLNRQNSSSTSIDSPIKGVFVRRLGTHGSAIVAFFDIRYTIAANTFFSQRSTAGLDKCVNRDAEKSSGASLDCRFVTTPEIIEMIGDSDYLRSLSALFHVRVEPGNTTREDSEKQGSSQGGKDEINATVLRNMLTTYGDVMSFRFAGEDEDGQSVVFTVEYFDLRDSEAAFAGLDGQPLFGMQLKVFRGDAPLSRLVSYFQHISICGHDDSLDHRPKPTVEQVYEDVRYPTLADPAPEEAYFATPGLNSQDRSQYIFPTREGEAGGRDAIHPTFPRVLYTSPFALPLSDRESRYSYPTTASDSASDSSFKESGMPTSAHSAPSQVYSYFPAPNVNGGPVYASCPASPPPMAFAHVPYPISPSARPYMYEYDPRLGTPMPWGYDVKAVPYVPMPRADYWCQSSASSPNSPDDGVYSDGPPPAAAAGPDQQTAEPLTPSGSASQPSSHYGRTPSFFSRNSYSSSTGLQSRRGRLHPPGTSSATQALPERNILNLEKIEDSQDTRTTVMIKNIPNKMSDKDLIAYIGEVCPRRIDFLYLRMDFKNECNVGYAFVNFITVQDLLSFARNRLRKKWNLFSSEKVLQMSYANYQGKEALVEKFKNSCIMDEKEAWKPKIFYSQPGPEQGLPEPFPSPTHLRRKERSSYNRGTLYSPNAGGPHRASSSAGRDQYRRHRSSADDGRDTLVFGERKAHAQR